MKNAMTDGTKPRQYTMDAWEAAFLSWSIVDQDNAMRTLASLHTHAKRGRLGPVAAVPKPAEAMEPMPMFGGRPEAQQ